MKVLQSINYNDVLNFGTKDQKYITAHDICISKKGCVWKVFKDGRKEKIYSQIFFTKKGKMKQMREKEARELFIAGVFNSHDELLEAMWG